MLEHEAPFRGLLDRLNSFVSLPDAERRRIVPMLRRRTLQAGDFFVRSGEISTTVGYMERGVLRYYYIAPDGREFIRHFCFGGHFVSSSSSVQTGTPSAYSIQAIEESLLITFSYADWISLVGTHTVWGRIGQRIQEEALILAERRERSLILDDAKTRYLQCLEEFPGIETRVKQYDIASYLGITPVALSRLRGKPSKN